MKTSKIAKKARRYWATATMSFAVIITTSFSALFEPDHAKSTQQTSVLPLSNSVIVSVGQDTNLESAQAWAAKKTDAPNSPVVPQWQTVRMRVTAYCPCPVCCGRLAQGRTANGHLIRQGERFVAAPKTYPFGTEIIVPLYNNEKPIRVLDRGGAIKGNCLDLFFGSHAKAARWGVKYLDVKIRVPSGNK